MNKQVKTHSLNRDRLQSSLGNYILVIAQAMRSLMLAAILAPSHFGKLSIANSTANFTQYGDLATGTLAELEGSKCSGERRILDRDHWLNIGFTYRMLSATLISTALLAFWLLQFLVSGVSNFVVLYVLAAAPLQAYWLSVRGMLRVTFEFRTLLYLQVCQALVWLTVTPGLALTMGLEGALVGLLAGYAPPLIWGGLINRRLKFVKASWSSIFEAVRQSFGIWLLYVTSFGLLYIDQMFASFASSTLMGYLSLALLVGSALAAISDGASGAIHPRTVEAFKQEGSLQWNSPFVGGNVLWVGRAFNILVPLAWIGAGVVVKLWLPEYTPATPLLLLTPLSAVLVGTTVATNATLLVYNRHHLVPWIGLVAVLVKFVLYLVVGVSTLTPELIAMIGLSGSVVYAFLYFCAVQKTLDEEMNALLFFVISNWRVLCLTLFALAAVTLNVLYDFLSPGTMILLGISTLFATGCIEGIRLFTLKGKK